MNTEIFKEEIYKEIADDVSAGLIAFVNLDTGEYRSYTEMGLEEIDFYDDDIDWQREEKEYLEKMENWEHRLKITPMESFEAFQVMEDFANECIPENDPFQKVLLKELSKSRPFARFKDEVFSSPYLQDWYKFKLEKYMEYVKDEIQRELKYLNEYK